jgi:predicted Zn-dependent protease
VDQGQVQEKLRDLETSVLEDARKFQELVEARGAVYEDPQLQVYLEELSRPLVPPLPPSSPYRFRVKVISDPTLNAFVLGDGLLYLNTGLIARVKTSQQLAFVIGHEIGHAVNRDLVYFTDNLHRKTVASKLSGLVVTPALSAFGLGGIGELGIGLAYAASVTGYGREREARADEDSLKAMRRLGYDEREALRVFETFLAEHERYHRGIEIGFLSSHPSNQQRLKAVKKFMGSKALDVFAAEPSDERFLDITHRLRVDNASFNIELGRFYHAAEDLQIILRRTPDDALGHFHLAEAYRRIAEDPRKLKDELSRKAWRQIAEVAEKDQQPYWESRALEEYQQALQLDPQLAPPHRGLGLLRQAQGQREEALTHFTRYLELAPDAKDRRFVVSVINRLERAPSAEAE